MRTFRRKTDKCITHFKVRNLVFPTKATRKLKPVGEITVCSTSVTWGDSEIAIELHCDAGGFCENHVVMRKFVADVFETGDFGRK